MTEITIPSAETVNITELKTDGKNPNRMSKEQHERLATSIKKYGFIVPIITNKDLLIADGEQRWTVAKSLGMKQVSVIRLPVEDVDRRLLRQVLNKLKGEHELLLDAAEFEQIIGAGREDELKYLLDLSDEDLAKYLGKLHPAKDEDYEVPDIETVETKIKQGDIFQLGKHRLMCGNSLNKEHVAALVDNTPIGMIFIDPPYGIDYSGGRTQTVAHKAYGKIEGDANPDISKYIVPFVDMASDMWVCASPINLMPVLSPFTKIDGIVVWKKNQPSLGYQHIRRYCEFIIYKSQRHKDKETPSEFDWWEIPTNNKTDYQHGTQKPTQLIERAIRFCNPQIVADFYGGSGSTLLACERTGKICLTLEWEPKFCEVICQRWEKYTGQKRVKLTKSETQ
jgi:DNA modification methylase